MKYGIKVSGSGAEVTLTASLTPAEGHRVFLGPSLVRDRQVLLDQIEPLVRQFLDVMVVVERPETQ